MFPKRYSTFLYLKGRQNYQLSKFFVTPKLSILLQKLTDLCVAKTLSWQLHFEVQEYLTLFSIYWCKNISTAEAEPRAENKEGTQREHTFSTKTDSELILKQLGPETSF